MQDSVKTNWILFITVSLSQEKTVSTFTSDENEQPIPLPVIETVSAVRNSKRQGMFSFCIQVLLK